ncbi:DNA-binding transcriptional regulator GbsR (MarR family) [Tenacibaculum adriaticum]|uniref:DNA-binding transcriptional regulator GbsR (MarR family) n=1 Tax=Tenacibaculum adriaticum TaxID=413713 RepID=A0A5S5DTG4_9FLAO|nr:transcriptional regulator [Tenacibaculum adriaticum]TYP98152.1 DNA-binding transcriptional regulator GbsR (MarR family) [Tenacibaculum adriaticum]
MSATICKQKQNLVERLGVLLENKEQLAPVAARILSYIILTGKVGTTFEDLVTHLCASKSTISTHLNHLQNLKKILYFTKPGDRKKYFTINQDNIIQSIDNMMESWLDQKDLHLEIKAYKVNANSVAKDEASKFDLDFHDNYIKFLNEATKSISELRTKIIENNNKI